MQPEQIKDSLTHYQTEAYTLRRQLHQIPERGFQEFKTQAFIMNYLEGLGLKPEKIIDTGVVAFIPGNGVIHETIAFRSDMDGLDGTEDTGLDCPSRHEGMMHACGHDGHMTMLLIFAKFLVEHPGLIPRDILLVFQPAEEGPGGAKPMVESGVFDRFDVSAIFGTHLFPFIKEGVVATAPGPIIAMTSEFYIDILGKSGHAANPDQCVDAIVASADYISSLQKIISRTLNPRAEALLSVGTIEGGTRMNVVADKVSLSGTVRSFDEEIQREMKTRMVEMARGIEIMYGCTIKIRFDDMYPPVKNNPELYEKVWPVLGEHKQIFEKQMIAEDFAMYGKKIPALFMGLGIGNEEKGFTNGLHSPKFNFDEKVLLSGVEAYCRIAMNEKAYKA